MAAIKNKRKPAKDRWETFCQEYIVDLIATHAAIRAGYSKNSAYSTGSRMLKDPKVRMRIAELMDERSKRTLVDADFVVSHLIDIAHKCQSKVPVMVFNPVDKVMEQKKDGDDANVWEFDSNGANRALELLGRHLAMFTEKNKITINHEQPLFPDVK